MKITNLILLACASTCATALAENTCCGAWPEGKDPAVISARITDQFLSGRPEDYHPQGYHGNKGYGWKRSVQYSVVSLWLNAIECARLRGDKDREEKLVRLFDDFLPGGKLSFCCSRPYHVDDTIFGALPYEIYLGTKEPKYLALGNYYADTQWTPPGDGTVKERHALPREKQEEFWKGGYTPQTRAFDRVQPEGYDGVLHATLPAVALVAVVALRMVVFGASAQELVGDARGDDGGVFAFRPGAAAGVLRKGRRAHRRAGQQDQVRCLHVRFLFSLP